MHSIYKVLSLRTKFKLKRKISGLYIENIITNINELKTRKLMTGKGMIVPRVGRADESFGVGIGNKYTVSERSSALASLNNQLCIGLQLP